MKQGLTLLGLLCLQGSTRLAPDPATRYPDTDYIKACADTGRDTFRKSYSKGRAADERPKDKSFRNSLWIGSIDAGGLLHAAANPYTQTGVDIH